MQAKRAMEERLKEKKAHEKFLAAKLLAGTAGNSNSTEHIKFRGHFLN